MFKVKYLVVEITKGKMSKIVTSFPQWEAQVVVALWGDEAQILGEGYEMRELPEVNDEFTRLANKYGPRDEDVPIVARVYGSFGPGLKSLESEFAASTMSIETETVVEGEENSKSAEVNAAEVAAPKQAGASGAGNSAAPVSGVTLPGSDKTFGVDAVPKVQDDIPALAGNLVTVGGEVKPLEEVLSDATKAAAEFDDLTGEGADSPQVE